MMANEKNRDKSFFLADWLSDENLKELLDVPDNFKNLSFKNLDDIVEQEISQIEGFDCDFFHSRTHCKLTQNSNCGMKEYLLFKEKKFKSK